MLFLGAIVMDAAKKEPQEIEDILNEIENLQSNLKEDLSHPQVAEPSATALPPPAAALATPRPALKVVESMSGSALLDAAIEMGEEPVADETFEEEAPEEEASETESTLTDDEADEVEKFFGEQAMQDSDNSDDEGSLTLSLTGNMALKLNYECAGQSVTVSFSDGALKIQTADGAEFKIPVGRTSHHKAA